MADYRGETLPILPPYDIGDHFGDHDLCERERAVQRGEVIRREHPKRGALRF